MHGRHADDLGLKAALELGIDQAELLDYAMLTANTIRDAVMLAARYNWQRDDQLQVSCRVEDQRAILSLGWTHSVSRAVIDFALGAWFRTHLQPRLEHIGPADCCFRYSQPDTLDLHQRVFAGAKLRFDAAFDGFAFAAHALEALQSGANPRLHQLLCSQLDVRTHAKRNHPPASEQVRHVLAAQLRAGRTSAIAVASQLNVSRRTLARQLQREGTTFSALLSDVQRDLSEQWVPTRELTTVEIASKVGYSSAQGFRRAFKRWTGMTPVQYRKRERGR